MEKNVEEAGPRRGMLWAKAALLVVTGFLIFFPAFNGEWLWDDALYLSGNSLLHDPARLWKAWFAPGTFIEYYPIEQTVQWGQWKLWGSHTFGYHLTNLLLHIASGFLIWRLLAKFHLRLAWLGGLLFILHPMNVSSVANISELKNTLSLPPFLLAMCAFIDFEENRRPRDYLLALGFFLASMLCKITMAPFPAVMLLYAWWRRGRIGLNDLKLAAPFIVISLVLAALTYKAGVDYANLYPFHPAPLPEPSLLGRLALIGLTLSFYLRLFFLPNDPLQFYPRWPVDSPSPLQFLPWAIAAIGLFIFWKNRKTCGRHILLGLGFFLITLLPFSGLMTISYMNYSWVMDHFLYLPMIGLIGLVITGIEQLGKKTPSKLRPVGIAAISVVCLALATRSQDYAAAWTDSCTFWTYTIEHNPNAWLAHYNLGNDYRRHKQYDQAIAEYRTALAINPNFDWADNNLGMALEQSPAHLTDDAIASFKEAVRIRPHFPEAHNNLANLLSQSPDNLPEAVTEYQAALSDRPDFAEAHYNLGLVLTRMPGHEEEAAAQLREATRLNPKIVPNQATPEKASP